MKHKINLIVICVLLALILAAEPLMVAYSEGTGAQEYLSDLKIGYGDAGKQKLLQADYKVYAQNVNENGDGEDVWIGYKTSFNKKDAITDVTTMRMNGNYSFDKYDEYVQNLKETANQTANSVYKAFEEFKGLLTPNQTDVVTAVYDYLNIYYDDDTIDSTTKKPMKIGEMIKNGFATKERIVNLVFLGNYDYLNDIYKLLGMGLAANGENFANKLSTIECVDSIDQSKNQDREFLLESINDVREYLQSAKKYGEEAKSYIEADEKNGFENYLKKFGEDSKAKVFRYVTLYLTFSSVIFGSNLEFENQITHENERLNLYQALTLPTEEELEAMDELPETGELFLDLYIVEVLRKALTEGQMALLTTITLNDLLGYLISNSSNEGKTQLLKELSDGKKEFSASDSISVYDGVDKSLLIDYYDVALTGKVVEDIDKGLEVNIGRKAYNSIKKHEKVEKILSLAGCWSMVAGFFSTIAFASLYNNAKIAAERLMESATKVTDDLIAAALKKLGAKALSKALLYKIGMVLGVVCFVVGIAMLITKILLYRNEIKEVPKVTYTRIPRALVHEIDEGKTKVYINYYATKLIDASDNRDDFMNVYGDLNGRGGHCEWLVLYHTKDTDAGEPLSGNARFVYDNQDLSLTYANHYIPVHGFDIEAATDLNGLNYGEGIRAIYMYMEQSTGDGLTGSIFGGGTILISATSALCGAAIAFLATFFAMRKKKVVK